MNPDLVSYAIYLAINITALALISVILYATGAAKVITTVLIPIFQEVSAIDKKTVVFSWKKAMTAVTTAVFAICCIGYAFLGARELPSPYWATIAGVFGTYFFKPLIDRIQIGQPASEPDKNG